MIGFGGLDQTIVTVWHLHPPGLVLRPAGRPGRGREIRANQRQSHASHAKDSTDESNHEGPVVVVIVDTIAFPVMSSQDKLQDEAFQGHAHGEASVKVSVEGNLGVRRHVVWLWFGSRRTTTTNDHQLQQVIHLSQDHVKNARPPGHHAQGQDGHKEGIIVVGRFVVIQQRQQSQ